MEVKFMGENYKHLVYLLSELFNKQSLHKAQALS